MSATFRVEAFIIPSLNRERTSENIIDDVKVACKLREIDFPKTLECINEESEFSDHSVIEKSFENCDIPQVNEFSKYPSIKIDLVRSEEENENFYGEKLSEIDSECEQGDGKILPTIKINFFKAEMNSDGSCDEPIYEIPFARIEKLEESEKLRGVLCPGMNRGFKDQQTPLPSLPVCSSSPKYSGERGAELEELSEVPDEKKNLANSNVFSNSPKAEMQFLQSDDDSGPDDKTNEPIYDIPYSCKQNPKSEALKFIKKLETGEFVSSRRAERFRGTKINYPKPPIRSTSLMSIDERGETPDDCLDQLCCHGLNQVYPTQRPEQVTEEIFEINWMKRLENLRAREAVIKEKEAMLFDRERLLFKKERELRILERLIKDKLKHAELCSKRIKHSNMADPQGSKENLAKQLSSLESLESIKYDKIACTNDRIIASTKSLNVFTDKIPSAKILNSLNDRIAGKLPGTDRIGGEGARSTGSVISESSNEGKNLKNPPNSRSSLVSSVPDVPVETGGLTHQGKSTSTGYSSVRRRRRPRPSYDDLDSTLSADIGDSSFVVTSRKFDPIIIKKPQAFTRSASERRPHIEEDKVLKRISENIFVSQDKHTKFQDYGLIDLGRRNEKDGDEKKYSYLNLERGRVGKERGRKEGKDRPISWNEEQNEWLQKKRMAYNCTVRRMPTEDFDNKENFQKKEEVKKKVMKVKKFSIFR